MGSYVKSALVGDEKIIYQGKVSVWSMIPLLTAGLLTLPVVGLGLLFWIAAFMRYLTTEVAFTDKRVIAKFGFISRRTVELALKKIESLQIDQGILGRTFNYGSIVISGAGNPQAPVPGISDPMTFRRSLMEYQDRESTA